MTLQIFPLLLAVYGPLTAIINMQKTYLMGCGRKSVKIKDETSWAEQTTLEIRISSDFHLLNMSHGFQES